LALAFLCAGGIRAEAQLVRDDFDVTNDVVTASIVEGNTLYLAGDFTRIGQLTGSGVPISATSGIPVSGFPKVDGNVVAVIPDGVGGWYIGGRFASVGGTPRNNIAHVLADNTVSPWDPNATSADGPNAASVSALAMSGSVVYAGGRFTSIGGQSRINLAALEASTGTATAWNADVDGSVVALAVGGTTVYVGGSFGSVGGQARTSLGAIDTETGQVLSWAPDLVYPGSRGIVSAVAVSGSTVYVGGLFTSVAGLARSHVAALDAATGLPTAWNPNPNGQVRALAVDGTLVYVGGDFGTIGGQARRFVGAIDTDTGLATAWDPAASGRVWALALGGGAVYVGGDFREIGGQPRNHLAAVDVSSGAVTAWDPDAGGGALARVRVLAVDGTTVYAGGSFGIVGGQPRHHLAAVDLRTGRATAWDPNPNAAIAALAAAHGVIYAAGNFTEIGGQSRTAIAALNPRSGLASSWNPNPSGVDFPVVRTVAVVGADVFVAGYFAAIGGRSRTNLAALDHRTGHATAWQPSVDQSFGGVSVLTGGHGVVFAGGSGFIDALDARTGATIWGHEWLNEQIGNVNVLALGPGALYVNHAFGRYVTALDPATGAVKPWHPDDPMGAPTGSLADIYAIAVRGNTVYVGGTFYGWGEQPIANLVALDATTGGALDWKVNPDFWVNTIAFAGPNLVAGGAFDAVGQSVLTTFPNGTLGFAGGSSRSNLAVISVSNNTGH
jgi:hypothetical protein